MKFSVWHYFVFILASALIVSIVRNEWVDPVRILLALPLVLLMAMGLWMKHQWRPAQRRRQRRMKLGINLIIAVDGPTASGKGTIAKALAAHFGLPHLDTGLLYRAVGVYTVQQGGDPDVPADALAGCSFPERLLSNHVLRSESAGSLASRASQHPVVRAALLERQRAFANQPGGAVLDGRDIGTVIAPHAQVKLFVTASVAERARRRHAEMAGRGETVTYESIAADLEARDRRDSTRAVAPLKPAADALLLDTSDLTIGAAVQRAIALVNGKTEGGAPAHPAGPDAFT